MSTVALLHPGQMGAAIGQQLVQSGTRVLWMPHGRSAASAERAGKAGLEPVDGLAACAVVISLCPPEFAEEVAATVAASGFDGVFVEANAISPQRVTRIGQSLPSLVDGCVIGPPPTGRAGARLYLCGPDAADVSSLFSETAVEAVVMDGPIGSASALKMAYGSYNKISGVLAAVSHALADAHGVDEELTELAQGSTRSRLADPGYLPSVAARAWRWGPEMAEVAATLEAAGLPGELAESAASVLKRWDDDKDRFEMPLSEVLDHLRS